MEDMTTCEFIIILELLNITQDELANLLCINVRTVRRWIKNAEKITGPAQQAMRAWLKLHTIGMSWRPDGIDVLPIAIDNLKDIIFKTRNDLINLDGIIQKVEASGGPSTPWLVNIKKRMATCGPVWVQFCLNDDKTAFSPTCYGRSDKEPNIHRDMHLISDSYYLINMALKN
jgi:hypothetical protein